MIGMIGPIPAIPTGDATPWMDCNTVAPTRPAWGGYLPVREPPARGPAPGWGDPDEAHAAYAAETAASAASEASATEWRADTTETRLVLGGGGWYVQRPNRPCRRAVVIAADAIRDGAEPPPGVRPEEEAKAREILASGDPRVWAWAASVTEAWETLVRAAQIERLQEQLGAALRRVEDLEAVLLSTNEPTTGTGAIFDGPTTPRLLDLCAEVTALRAELAKPVAGPWSGSGATWCRIDSRYGRLCAARCDSAGWRVYAIDLQPGRMVAASGPEIGPDARTHADAAAVAVGWRLL